MGPFFNVLIMPACYTCPVLSFSYSRTNDKLQKSLFSISTYVSVRVLQRNKTKTLHTDLEKEIDYEELAHVIKKAEKSHNIPLASWRPREDSGIVSV